MRACLRRNRPGRYQLLAAINAVAELAAVKKARKTATAKLQNADATAVAHAARPS